MRKPTVGITTAGRDYRLHEGSDSVIKLARYSLIVTGIWLAVGIASAANLPGDGLVSGSYPLIPVTNHTPTNYKNADVYWNSLQEVKLVVGGQEEFRDLPTLGMKHPFTGTIIMGDKPQKFGVIVDINGDEKRLYIDTDGDGSFAQAPWFPLLNEWYGLQRYTVNIPDPIILQVNYNAFGDGARPVQIMVGGFLNKPGPLVKEQPYLRIEVRTWFLAKLRAAGGTRLAAVVDHNHNGRYDDSEDELYIDGNDDGFFEMTEAVPRKRGIRLRSGNRELPVDWSAYPERLVIGGNEDGRE